MRVDSQWLLECTRAVCWYYWLAKRKNTWGEDIFLNHTYQNISRTYIYAYCKHFTHKLVLSIRWALRCTTRAWALLGPWPPSQWCPHRGSHRTTSTSKLPIASWRSHSLTSASIVFDFKLRNSELKTIDTVQQDDWTKIWFGPVLSSVFLIMVRAPLI